MSDETSTETNNSTETVVSKIEAASATNATTVSETSTATTDWRSSLPEDLKGEKSLESIKDVGSLAKSFINSQKMLGGRIPIPSKDASDEVKKEFYEKITAMPNVVKLPDSQDLKDPKVAEEFNKVYDKLGRPKDATKYKLDVPKDAPIDKNYLDIMKKAAYGAGLSQNQFKALADVELEINKKMAAAISAHKENSREFLKKEWGNTYEQNKAACNGVMNKFAEKYPDAVKDLWEGPAGNNPVVLLMAAELGRIYQEQGTIAISSGVNGSSTSPEQAKEHISEIMSNKQHPYHDARSPGHAEAVAKVQKLYLDAFPNYTK